MASLRNPPSESHSYRQRIMASFPNPIYSLALSFLVVFLHFHTLYAYSSSNISSSSSSSSFDFNNFVRNWKFESHFVTYGDAKVVNGIGNGNSSVQISGSVAGSAGRLLSKEPIKFLEGNPRNLVSFAMSFVFSMSNEKGDGLALFMAQKGYPVNEFVGGSFGLLAKRRKFKFIAVEFDTFKDKESGDLNDNHVGIDIDSLVSVKVRNVSFLDLNSGEKLQSWIDYEASSKRLEVRLTKLGMIRPVNPLISYPVDLSRFWGPNEEVFVGLSSSNGNSSSQKCNVCSWSLKIRPVPYWMHSDPLDPLTSVDKKKEIKNVNQKSDCALRILAALIFCTGCVALGAFLVLFVWTILGNKRPVVPEDFAIQPVEFDQYKNKSSIEDGKN